MWLAASAGKSLTSRKRWKTSNQSQARENVETFASAWKHATTRKRDKRCKSYCFGMQNLSLSPFGWNAANHCSFEPITKQGKCKCSKEKPTCRWLFNAVSLYISTYSLPRNYLAGFVWLKKGNSVGEQRETCSRDDNHGFIVFKSLCGKGIFILWCGLRWLVIV